MRKQSPKNATAQNYKSNGLTAASPDKMEEDLALSRSGLDASGRDLPGSVHKKPSASLKKIDLTEPYLESVPVARIKNIKTEQMVISAKVVAQRKTSGLAKDAGGSRKSPAVATSAKVLKKQKSNVTPSKHHKRTPNPISSEKNKTINQVMPTEDEVAPVPKTATVQTPPKQKSTPRITPQKLEK